MKNVLATVLTMVICFSVNAQTIFGKWETRNEETNKVDSVVEIYEKDGKAFAKIIEVKDPKRRTAVCEKCEGENKDKPILGLNIMTGLEKDGDEWSGGEIVDPRNGKVYDCYIKLVNRNKLKLRGYIGFSLLGKTRYWYRAK